MLTHGTSTRIPMNKRYSVSVYSFSALTTFPALLHMIKVSCVTCSRVSLPQDRSRQDVVVLCCVFKFDWCPLPNAPGIVIRFFHGMDGSLYNLEGLLFILRSELRDPVRA